MKKIKWHIHVRIMLYYDVISKKNSNDHHSHLPVGAWPAFIDVILVSGL